MSKLNDEAVKKFEEAGGYATSLGNLNNQLSHAVQSGVLMEQQLLGDGEAAATPKHLRTGINVAMCETSALARILVAKGICTVEEYFEMVNAVLEEEVGRYQERLSEATGQRIILG